MAMSQGQARRLEDAETVDCAQMKVDYQSSCFKKKGFMAALNIDTDTLNSATNLARVLDDYAKKGETLRKEDDIREYFHLLRSVRRYLYRCTKKREAYNKVCLTREFRNEMMVEQFATLKYRQLQLTYDAVLETLSRNILRANGNCSGGEEIYDLPGLENEDGDAYTFSGSMRGEALYVLERLESGSDSIVVQFLQSIYPDPQIFRDIQGRLYWSFTRIDNTRTSSVTLFHHCTIRPDLQGYLRLITACKFDRTVFVKVIKMIKFMSANKFPMDHDGVQQFVSVKMEFLCKTLSELSANDVVWSYIRLPSSTSILMQILLSDSLLNTSATRDFKLVKGEMVKNLEFALRYIDKVNDFNGRPDIDVLTESYIAARPASALSGLRPSWLGELMTRGHYGRLFFVTRELREYKAIVDRQRSAPQVDLSAAPPPKGRTIFELSTLDGSKTRLIRGDLDVASSGHLRITTDAEFDKTYWVRIFLPIDETLVGAVTETPGEEEVNRAIGNLVPFNVETQQRSMCVTWHQGLMFAKYLPFQNMQNSSNPVVFPRTYSAEHSTSLVSELEWAKF